MRHYTLKHVVAMFAVLGVTACSTAPALTSSSAPSQLIPSLPARPALNAWGSTATLADGATLAVSQPIRDLKTPVVTYTVTVTNTAPNSLLTNVNTSDMTAGGLAVDDNTTLEDDPGYKLGVAPGKALTYTVHRRGIPATATTLSFGMYVNFGSGNAAIDRAYWNGDIKR
jgi:hypothetical protein